jgi:hypothetical protein
VVGHAAPLREVTSRVLANFDGVESQLWSQSGIALNAGLTETNVRASKRCWSAAGQRHHHLRREKLTDAGDGDCPDLLIGQFQLEAVTRVPKFRGGLVWPEGAAPTDATCAVIGTERRHACHAGAVAEDQPCRAGVGRHSDDRNGSARVVADPVPRRGWLSPGGAGFALHSADPAIVSGPGSGQQRYDNLLSDLVTAEN